ncbi:MAG: dihydropteroate synthase [Actinobacteria bacterium RBG_16_64_13]|nr:MAG: dihydropteroate synthase [Actinobacteria bacterium RBG_16_64_13]
MLRDLAGARAALERARVSSAGVAIMHNKALFRVVRVSGLDVRAASILKQEMLARGGEVAVSREVYEWRGDDADCLIMGTMTQFELLLPKLRLQPFGLRALAGSLEAALANYGNSRPACHPGITLTGEPLMMGILNVTPDSFSDGGLHSGLEAAVRSGLEMADEGAAFIDVGGESTRPGADTVSAEDELLRVLPVVKALAPSLPGRVSVDTYKARVAAEALAAGAFMINDISALRMEPEMVAVVRDAGCPLVLMHMLGEPKTMQQDPVYEDVVKELYTFFVERLNWAVDNGLKEENLLIDPGLGFGKTTVHNLEILQGLDAFRSLGRPVLVGASRKRFLGEILGIDDAQGRDAATAATTVIATAAGAHMVRVHRVGLNRDAARVAWAVFGPRAQST